MMLKIDFGSLVGVLVEMLVMLSVRPACNPTGAGSPGPNRLRERSGLMLSNIPVTTDASPASDRLVECIKGLRQVGSRKVVLTHVVNVRNAGGLYDTIKKHILPRLEAQQKSLAAAGFDVSLEIPRSKPCDANGVSTTTLRRLRTGE